MLSLPFWDAICKARRIGSWQVLAIQRLQWNSLEQWWKFRPFVSRIWNCLDKTSTVRLMSWIAKYCLLHFCIVVRNTALAMYQISMWWISTVLQKEKKQPVSGLEFSLEILWRLTFPGFPFLCLFIPFLHISFTFPVVCLNIRRSNPQKRRWRRK